MPKPNKNDRKERIKQWQDAGRAKLIASMPLNPAQLKSLLDYLDANLRSCDHTTKLTDIFLHVEKLDSDRILPWLAENGGYCDCEVLSNLDDLAESFRERLSPPKPKQKSQRDPRELTTATGWDFNSLPKPWRVANLYAPKESLKLEMGRKGGCTITIVESTLPPGSQESDAYWSKLWYARTKLAEKSPMQVTRNAMELPGHLQSTLVQTSSWTPVYCWVYLNDQKWHLEIRTELDRQKGDLPQIAALLTKLVTTNT